MSHFFFVRHALNDAVGNQLAGRDMSLHLNEAGFQQAQITADWLAKFPIQRIVSSPMTRALETAAPLAERLGLPVEPCELLTEVDYGKFSGRKFDELKEDAEWREIVKNPAAMVFPGGESSEELSARLASFLAPYRSEEATDEIIACFTHSDVVSVLVALCLEVPMQNYPRIRIDPASITAVSLAAQGCLVHFVNRNQQLDFKFPQKSESH